jgi:hypothetical protein
MLIGRPKCLLVVLVKVLSREVTKCFSVVFAVGNGAALAKYLNKPDSKYPT